MKKKLLLLLLFYVFMFTTFELYFTIDQYVVKADAVASGMGFTVRDDTYGYKGYEADDGYVYYDNYIIGYAKLEEAVYGNKTNSNYAYVLFSTTSTPKDAEEVD